MGVAGYGDLFNSWSQEDFDLCSGKTGFEIAHRHYYASAEDPALFTEPEQWAENSGVPLFWGELADNSVYPLTRYSFAEEEIWNAGGQAITSMVLTGTEGYPYTGGKLEPQPAKQLMSASISEEEKLAETSSTNNADPYLSIIGLIGALFLFMRFRGKL